MSRSASDASAHTSGENSVETERSVTVEVHHVYRDAPKGTAFFQHPEKWEDRREHYRHVATAEVSGSATKDIKPLLEDAWRELQNGAGGNKKTVAVEPHVARRRSTSVGDVMIVKDVAAGDREEAVPFEVGHVGFRKIIDENHETPAPIRNLRPIGEIGPASE